MPNLSRALQDAIDSAHIPAVSYAYVEPDTQIPGKFVSTSIALGKKNAQSTDIESTVSDDTRFPASSLSKIVFTYLVLELVKNGQINLDEPLLPILQRYNEEYERFKVNGNYPDNAIRLTARNVLSHTTGLPNWNDTLRFDTRAALGTGYSYSGEAFLFLQKVIETKMSNVLGTEVNLEMLAKRYVFDPLHMDRSTFLTQPQDDTNIVDVHTEIEKPVPFYELEHPPPNSAASLLTTANDFSNFIKAWLEKMDDPIIKQAFEFETSLVLSGLQPIEFNLLSIDDNTRTYLKNATENSYNRVPFNQAEVEELKRAIDESTHTEIQALSEKLVFEPSRSYNIAQTCGLGWHIYKKNEEIIAYQYGMNPNTISFVAINVKDRKGTAFFTNSENGMSIANQIMTSAELAPIGDLHELFKHMRYSQNNEPMRWSQSDEPGWKETIAGKIAEDHGNFEEARSYFEQAFESSPEDGYKQRCLEWFDEVHTAPEQIFTKQPELFVGKYTNNWEEVEIYIKDNDSLICEYSGQEIKLVRVSETDFLPEKDQTLRISFNKNQMEISFVHGGPNKEFPNKQFSLKDAEVHSEDPALTELQSSAETLYLAKEKIRSFKDRVPHEPPTTEGDITEDMQKDENSNNPTP